MTPPRALAAIDCGTNSLRLLIGEVIASGGVRVLRRETRIVGLGQGVDETGRLSPVAVERALVVLREYAQLIAAAGVSRVRMVATSASRDAQDAEAFLDQARAALAASVANGKHGVAREVDVAVISGAEEARLSLLGATGGLDDPGPYVVVDVGGGSTELAVGERGSLTSSVSLDVGCVRLTERFVRHDPPTLAELGQARSLIRGLLSSAELPGLDQARTAVAVAGTAATVAAVVFGHAELDPQALRGTRVSMRHVLAAAERLSAMSLASRLALGPVYPGRAEVIPAGALVLAEVGVYLQEHVGLTEFLIREEDILDGVLLSL